MNEKYDSTGDTLAHIERVRELLGDVAGVLRYRAEKHDNSKLHPPEKELFDEYTPLLKTLEYGSQEYKASLAALKPALDHHYKMNSHHPEHYADGINGMCLIDMIEMLCDWRAACERTKGGYSAENFERSLEISRRRFEIGDQLFSVIVNTAKRLGYIS